MAVFSVQQVAGNNGGTHNMVDNAGTCFSLFLDISRHLREKGKSLDQIYCLHKVAGAEVARKMHQAVTPKVMVGFLKGDEFILYNACATQFFFFVAFITVANSLLASMAYDHCAAVCKPLHYTTTMTTNRHSCEGHQKAFSTCASHLTAVSIFYGTGIFMYL
ncbi:hypothetical protein H8959_003407 [Pygathrix nigripes]